MRPESVYETEPPAGPPDLDHAIHAAMPALNDVLAPAGHLLPEQLEKYARAAVEAAWPYAIGSASQHHWKRTATNQMRRFHEQDHTIQQLRDDIAQLDRARSELFDELQAVRHGNDRLQEFEQAITEGFGELRWDKISAALVALHAPALDQAAPEPHP